MKGQPASILVLQQEVKVFWVLQFSMEVGEHKVSWDGWRTIQCRVWPSSWQVLLSGQPWKKAPSVVPRFHPKRNQLVCSRAETGGSSYACRGDSQRAEPQGNRGSQIGCADERCFHTPTVVSPSEMLNTGQATGFLLTHHPQDQQGWSLLAAVTAIGLEVSPACGFSATVNSQSFATWGQSLNLGSAIFKS